MEVLKDFKPREPKEDPQIDFQCAIADVRDMGIALQDYVRHNLAGWSEEKLREKGIKIYSDVKPDVEKPGEFTFERDMLSKGDVSIYLKPVGTLTLLVDEDYEDDENEGKQRISVEVMNFEDKVRLSWYQKKAGADQVDHLVTSSSRAKSFWFGLESAKFDLQANKYFSISDEQFNMVDLDADTMREKASLAREFTRKILDIIQTPPSPQE